MFEATESCLEIINFAVFFMIQNIFECSLKVIGCLGAPGLIVESRAELESMSDIGLVTEPMVPAARDCTNKQRNAV